MSKSGASDGNSVGGGGPDASEGDEDAELASKDNKSEDYNGF